MTQNPLFSLSILATTDIHAHILPYDYYQNKVVENSGLLSLAKVIQHLRSLNPNTLLVDNGDFLQGTILGNYALRLQNKMHPSVTLMNALNYDAGTLGNHEFDFGIPFLLNELSNIHYPIVNANIFNEEKQDYFQKPYIILSKKIVSEFQEKSQEKIIKTIKIGITGVVPPQVKDWNKQVFNDYKEPLKLLDGVDAVNNAVNKMKNQKADLIIVLAHSGFSSRDYQIYDENMINELAKLPHIDAIIAGHAHQLYPNDTCPKVYSMPIVMSGSFAEYLGVIDFKLIDDNGWQIQSSNASLINTKEYLENHECDEFAIDAELTNAHTNILQLMDEVVGENHQVLNSYLSLIKDDSITELIAEVQKHYADKYIKEMPELNQYRNIPLLSAIAPFKVGGRNNAANDFIDIDKGHIKFKDIAALYPFSNYLAILKVTGKELREWLECANSLYFKVAENAINPQALINWKQHRTYKRDVIKGITYSVDITKERRYNGECELINSESFRINNLCYLGCEIKEDDEFLLATNQYRALSGQFPGTKESNLVALLQREIPDLLKEYIMQKTAKEPLNIQPSMNWRIEFEKIKTALSFESSATKRAEHLIKEQLGLAVFKRGLNDSGLGLYEFNN